MKTLSTAFILSIALISSAVGQDSFTTLKEKFSSCEDVFSFGTNGFLARTVLWMAGDHDVNEAVREIHGIRLIAIPTSAFHAQRVSVGGFKNVLRKDSFEELARFRDNGDDVTIYLKATQHRDNRYMVLIEESDNVVVIEIRGYIDPNVILNHENISYNH